MSNHKWIAILDFGSQYSQLIARRVREQQVYSELLRYDARATVLRARAPAGIILSGSPLTIFDPQHPQCDPEIFNLGIPVLGIDYGMHLTTRILGGKVEPLPALEYKTAPVQIKTTDKLLQNLPAKFAAWQRDTAKVVTLPKGFSVTACNDSSHCVAYSNDTRQIYGVHFHPEVAQTANGSELINNFIFNICRCDRDWTMDAFINESIARIREQVGTSHVVCGLSGGVDSSVVAALLQRAIGSQLHCIFVDTGLMRYHEGLQVERTFRQQLKLDLRMINAGDLFLNALKGITEPETKRKIVGKLFIDVFAAEARKLGDCEFLAQGTLYPDIIESVSLAGKPNAAVKSHHNVGGLPPDLKFKLIEPVRDLFKDEVRELGRALGLASELIDRQPFPGPGLSVRILGEVTAERVAILQQADLRVQEEIRKLPNYREIWQTFAILLPVKSVGVKDDQRTYENVCAIRAVNSSDGMTADWVRLPYETLADISNRIINEVDGINRVVFDISAKPPSTIEWE